MLVLNQRRKEELFRFFYKVLIIQENIYIYIYLFLEDGHTYERESISEWLSKNGTSPISREQISKDVLIVNRALKSQIEEFKKQKGILPDVKQKVCQFTQSCLFSSISLYLIFS